MKPDYQYDYTAYEAEPETKSLSGYVFGAGHRALESSLPRGKYDSVIEVGSGSGSHVRYVTHAFEFYLVTDLSDRMLDRSVLSQKVGFSECDAKSPKFPDSQFDRLVACHVLEHLESPHRVLREWHRITKAGGVISVLLPCDPGIGWRLARCLVRGKAVRRGIPYDYAMAREHINPINNLVSLIRYYFEDVSEAWWPLRVASIDVNLFYCCHILVHK